MKIDDPSEIEWLDDDDNQTTATPTTLDEQSAVTTETTQPRPRKPHKRQEKPVSRTNYEPEQQPDNSLFSLLFILVVAAIVIGTVVFFPGMMVIAAIFGTGGAIARAEAY